MELHQLRYFVAVAETGTFTEAAKRCFVSQPSLSQQIMKLEEELEQPLFDRLGRRVEPTEGGRRLLGRAQAILFEIEDAARAVKDAGEKGHLRIGVFPSIGPYLLPQILAEGQKIMPGVTISVREDFRTKLADAITAGDLDLFLGSMPPDRPELEVEKLFSEDLLVAVSSSHPLAKAKRVRPRDLAGQKLILLGEASSLALQTKRFFGAHQIGMEIGSQCAQVHSVKALVAAGVGLAIIPRMAIDNQETGIVYRGIQGLRPKREIVIVRHRHRFRSRAETAFVLMLKEMFGHVANTGANDQP